jgi:MFS family permease
MPTLLKSSGYAWLVVALLWLVALLNYLDRLAITTMRDPIKADITMTDAQFGLLTAVFLWVYAAFSPLGGMLADRVGRKRVIVGSLLFWSAATWLSGHAANFNQLFLARGLMGVSEACYLPAALALIADFHRGPTRSLATGLHMSGIYAGAALGGVGGYLAQYCGWRYGFTLLGAVGVGYALVLLVFLRDAPPWRPTADEGRVVQPPVAEDGRRNQCRLSLRERTRLSRSERRRSESRSFAGPSLWASLFGQPGFYLLLALNVFVSVVNWLINGWLPTYLKEHFSLSLGAAGLSATGYIQAASLFGALVGGAWADRWSRRHRQGRAWVPAIGYFAAAPCLLLAASTRVLPAAILGLAVFGLGRGFFDANLMPILRDLVGRRYSATGYGLLNCVGSAAGGMMVWAGGEMKDRHVDLGHVFQGCAAALLITAVMLLLVRVAQPTPDAKEEEIVGVIS